MIHDAREYSINKIKEDSALRGADADIGEIMESTMANEYIHVTDCRTSVYLEKNV